MEIVHLIGACTAFLCFHLAMPQKMCNTTWRKSQNSNFRNASKTNDNSTTPRCLDDCKNDLACLAVDIKTAPSNNSLTTCWFHLNSADLQTSYTFQGVDSYIKTIDCTGYTNIKSLWGLTGATGVKGHPGQIGPTGVGQHGPGGMAGFPGLQGATGFTGFTGSTGSSGATGDTGFTGFTGYTGFSGAAGVSGFTGDTGASGNVGPALYVKEACDPSWIILDNITSPNALPATVVVASLDDCLNLCLATPSCVGVDFTPSTISCWVHNVANNLNTKFQSPETLQLVLIQRCINQIRTTNSVMTGLWGRNEIVPVGETGATGPTGVTGLPGVSGLPGIPGMPGTTGSTGATGMTGYPGGTGSTGPTGSLGASGVKGIQGGTGQPGEMVYIRENCQPKWVKIEDVNSPVPPSSDYSIPDQSTCQNLCLTMPNCVAVNYNNISRSCQVIDNVAGLEKRFESPGVTQLVLVLKCPFSQNKNSTQNPVSVPREKKSDYRDENKLLVKVCKVSPTNLKPWYYALVMTPVMAVIINFLIFITYILMCRKFYLKRCSDDDDEDDDDVR